MSETITISPITEKQVSGWIDRVRKARKDHAEEQNLGKKLDHKLDLHAYKGVLFGILNALGRWKDEEGEDQLDTILRLAENLEDELEGGKQIVIDIV